MSDSTQAPTGVTFGAPVAQDTQAGEVAAPATNASANAPAGVTFGNPVDTDTQSAQLEKTPVIPPEQPRFLQRAAETSGASGLGTLIGQTGGYIGSMPARAYNRVQGLQAAYDALKQGDLKKATMIAHTLATGPDDPVTSMAKNLIKMPFDEAVEAYKAFKNNPDKVTATLSAAQHGIRSIPLIGAAAEQVGSTIAEDLHNNNWRGLSGDLAGIVPAILFGAEGKAAEAAEASGAEGAAEAAQEAKSSAIRPSQRMIGRTPVPVTALQGESGVAAQGLEKLANNPAAAQAKFAAERTQPAAVSATVNNLEDVARNHIQAVREQLGEHAPFEADMSTLRKQSGAMKDAAQEIYQKFDKASEEDQDAFQAQQKLKKEAFDAEQAEKKAAFDEAQAAKPKPKAGETAPKAEKFKSDTFEEDERPLTFREMQTQRADALKNMKAGTSPEAYKAAQLDLNRIDKQMDDFAADHTDVVAPEEYNLANATRRAAGQHDFITDRLNIDTGTEEIPQSITRGSLKALPRAFDKRYGEGAFQKYLGPQGASNYNAVRDVLENPEQSQGLMHIAKLVTQHAVGMGAGYALGGAPGAAAGAVLQYTAGRIAENLLFNPEYGQTVLAAYRTAAGLGHAVIKPPVLAAPIVPQPNATHTWSPETGIVPAQ